MSAEACGSERDERLLTFEIGESLYALPISAVVEIAEIEESFAAVPTLPVRIGGVINFHGDALPLVRSEALLGVEGRDLTASGQVVVIADGATEKARLGLPVDDILGLVSGARAVARGEDPVAERRSIDGRVAKILDPARLIATAETVIEQTLDGMT